MSSDATPPERLLLFPYCPPLKVALDCRFALQDNLKEAKKQGIKDVCFSKGRGLAEEDMCRSTYVYKVLNKFRAGIESGIFRLKRVIGSFLDGHKRTTLFLIAAVFIPP